MTAWNNVIGHEWAVQLLSGAIQHDRIGHAYLITGSDQIGKTTLARLFAQALNCEADSIKRPCGECRTCKLIAADRHPDVRLLEPEISGRGKQSIKIKTIRALQQDLNLSPYEGRRKIGIITRFDTANLNAANAFLKTLEEPPGNVILILTAISAEILLPTIQSRCRVIGLRPLPTQLIEEGLMTRWGVNPEDANLLSHLAAGRLGWAVEASQNPSILQQRKIEIEQLGEAVNGRHYERFALANKLSRKPENLPSILKTWLSWWHDLLLIVHGENGRFIEISNIDQQLELQTLAKKWNSEQILSSLRQTELALWQLQRNANTRLVIENLLLIYPKSSLMNNIGVSAE